MKLLSTSFNAPKVHFGEGAGNSDVKHSAQLILYTLFSTFSQFLPLFDHIINNYMIKMTKYFVIYKIIILYRQ